jgi:hypothetical protein
MKDEKVNMRVEEKNKMVEKECECIVGRRPGLIAGG